MLLGFFFVPSGMKEETHQPDGAGRANCDGQEHESLAGKYLPEGIGKFGFADR